MLIPEGAMMPTVAAIEAMLRAAGLRVTLRGSLATCPGCTHWHLKQGEERGVLELTLWRQRRRIWFSMQSGRKGAWILSAASALRRKIESKVAKSKSSAQARR